MRPSLTMSEPDSIALARFPFASATGTIRALVITRSVGAGTGTERYIVLLARWSATTTGCADESTPRDVSTALPRRPSPRPVTGPTSRDGRICRLGRRARLLERSGLPAATVRCRPLSQSRLRWFVSAPEYSLGESPKREKEP